MTDNSREAGSARSAEPAREQVVIKDKRKIDASGRVKSQAAASGENRTAQAADIATEQAGTEATMGQPGTPVTGAKASGSKSGGAEQSKGKPSAKPAKSEPAKADGAKPEPMKPESTKPEAPKPSAKPEKPTVAATEPEAPAAATPAPAVAEPIAGDLRTEIDERIRDLQRVSAEYANYRKRVERDRSVMAEQAIGNVISTLLPILDDLDRARDHGDLVGPFGAVAEQLTSALTKFGLTGFGEQGDTFDPTRHEAVAHQTSADVTEPTCVAVMRRGYLLGERLLRPAMVAVADPE